MRVAFCVPHTKLPLNKSCPPLNLGYLASYLRQYFPDITVRIIDGTFTQSVETELFKFEPDLVGITATTPQAPSAYKLADAVRRSCPDITVVVGGVHPSIMPDEALRHSDCVVVGEGERALVKIATLLDHSGKIFKAVFEEPYIQDLDAIPSPAFELMEIEQYLRNTDNPGYAFPFGLKHVRTATLITSRGCPFRCIFCHNSFRSAPPRWHSAERIVSEIQYFVERHKVNSVFFVDDEFVVNKKRLNALAELFKSYGFNESLVFGCQARATTLDVATMKLMKRMGFKFVSVGFESGNQRVLSLLKNRSVTVGDNERLLCDAERAGLGVGGSFIFGTPTETRSEMLDTLQFMESHESLMFMGVNVLIPYLGTEAWRLARQKGLLPNPLNYEKLIPTSKASDTYIVCDSMNKKAFEKLITDIQRVAIVTEKARLIYKSAKNPLRSFVGMFRFKLWWWMLLRHPLRFLKLVRKVVAKSV